MKKRSIKEAAICFSGQVKTLDLCYPYLKKNFLDNIKSYDIFCCAEDDSDIEKIDLLKPTKVIRVRSPEVDKLIKRDIDQLNKGNYKDFILPQSGRFNFRNIYQQLYKIKGVFKLLKQHMEENNVHYKYFIRIRFDFLPLNKIKMRDFNFKRNGVVTPRIRNLNPKIQVNDMFCVTRDIETFETYCSIIDHYKEVVRKNISLKTNFSKKLYLSFEKKYNSFFISLLKDKGQLSKNVLGFLLLLTKNIYFKFKEGARCSLEKAFFYHLKNEGKKVHDEPIDFIIVRNPMDGLLIFG